MAGGGGGELDLLLGFAELEAGLVGAVRAAVTGGQLKTAGAFRLEIPRDTDEFAGPSGDAGFVATAVDAGLGEHVVVDVGDGGGQFDAAIGERAGQLLLDGECAGEFHSNDRGGGVRFVGGQFDAQAGIGGGKFEFRTAIEHAGGGDLAAQAGDIELAVSRPFEDVKEQCATVSAQALGAAAPVEFEEGAGGGAINRLAIFAHPRTDGLHPLDAGSWDLAFRRGPEVEKEISTLADAIDEGLDEFGGGFPILVVALVAPSLVHGHAGLPIAAGETGGRNELLGGLGITWKIAAEAVVGDQSGAQRDQFGQRAGAFGGHPCRGVPPQDVRLVAEQDFARLGHCDVAEKIIEIPIMGGIPTFALLHFRLGSTGVHPVLGLGKVETEADVPLADGGGKRRKQIAAGWGGIRSVPIGDGRGVKREAVVMFRGDDRVARAGLLDQLRQGFGIVFRSGEFLGISTVFGHRDAGAQHDPLADARNLLAIVDAGRDGINAPVDENAELRLTPPRHAFVALCGGFGGIGHSKSEGCDHRELFHRMHVGKLADKPV